MGRVRATLLEHRPQPTNASPPTDHRQEPEGLSHADGALGQAHGSLAGLPARNPDYDFKLVSRVLTEPLRCAA